MAVALLAAPPLPEQAWPRTRFLSPLSSDSRLRVATSALTSCRSPPSVVVTRERGKNKKIVDLLHSQGIWSLELPLIEHRQGPDLEKLPMMLQDNKFDWIVITSPEAAAVFIEGWKLAGFPNVRLAVVGSGTGEVFDAYNMNKRIAIDFQPPKANAKSLAETLPAVSLEGGKVLYPSSVKASHELENGLKARGFQVTRLNTYSTDSSKDVDPNVLAIAVAAPVVALASPTAVRAWVDLIDLSTWGGCAACIGQTSAAAAQKAGIKRVFYPQNPGIEGWVQSILEALGTRSCNVTPI